MSSTKQREELQAAIWKIANDVRGAVDGWDFKQFVLGTLFYRFISENFTNFIEGGDESVQYAQLPDEDITPEIKDDATKTKGYFIYPSQLFVNVAKNANTNSNLNTDLAAIFSAIESSANGYPSEADIKGLFADFDTTSNRLGNTVPDKNKTLAKVINGVASLNFGDFENHQIDLFGDAYEFLISNYAANAGKSGGEFFTPQNVSKLIARLALLGQSSVNKIYDPACGSGSLLLQAKKHFDDYQIEEGFFGQEINHTTYNLARMNMLLHKVKDTEFQIFHGDSLTNDWPLLQEMNPAKKITFDAVVANPPFSYRWEPTDALSEDFRFKQYGIAPKSAADFAFLLHGFHFLNEQGTMAIILPHGVLFRGGAEERIRTKLLKDGNIDTIIGLPANLFYSTGIPVCIIVLKKCVTDKKEILFINASEHFEKDKRQNKLREQDIDKIIETYQQRKEEARYSRIVSLKEIESNGYNLNISRYISTVEEEPLIDLKAVTQQLKAIDSRIKEATEKHNQFLIELGLEPLP